MVKCVGPAIYATLDYERAREGIDDLKYLCKLESMIAEASKAGKASAECAAARAALQAISDAITDDWSVYEGKGGMRFPEDGFALLDPEKTAAFGKLNNLRLTLAGHILAIQSALEQ